MRLPPAARRRTWRLLSIAVFLASSGRDASAQTPTDSVGPAGAEYQYRGILRSLQQAFYGSRYRSLWAIPVAAPRSPLGIDPTPARAGAGDSARRIGGVLFWTPAGDLWEYRALDRDILSVTPPVIRENLLPSIVQGLNAARHPGAPPVVRVLAEAVGARVPSSQLVWFAPGVPVPRGTGRLGYLRQVVMAGLSTGEVLDSLRRQGASGFDARQYLLERLFDTYLGHWDDAPELWRWSRAADSLPWAPEPRDRDRAFAKYDGLLATVARDKVPGFVSFGAGFQDRLGVMAFQRTLDRQLLSLLDWRVWDSVTSALQASLTDSVITAAVGQLPQEYLAAGAEPLATGLRARRDGLRGAARQLYRLVNQEAAFFGSPGPDTVTVTRRSDGALEFGFRNGLRRYYAPGETDAIALYLGGGADQVELAGPGNVGPRLDLAWEPGLTVRGARGSGQRTTVYGGAPRAGNLRLDLVPDTLPTPEVEDLDLLRPPPTPLHGTAVGPNFWFDVNSDVGMLIGGGITLTTYRLGHDPYYRRLRIRSGYATAVDNYAIELAAEFRRWRSRAGVTLDAGLSEIAVLHFFGYGNTTPFTQPANFYLARQRQLYLYPAWNYLMTTHSRVAVGPVFKHVGTDTTSTSFINDTRPYGVPDFAQAGVLATATYDNRDVAHFTRTGWRIVATGSFYPLVFGGGKPFGTMQASAATYLTPTSLPRLTLALRASGRLVMGEVPVHEAAFIGGSTTVRGYESGRYAGEASAFFNSELRVHVATFPLVVPWQFGVVGIGDLGRVFNVTDDGQVWHGSAGGGIWFAMPDRSLGGVVTVVGSSQGSALWLSSGFMF
jgi:hypothetical protein